MSKAELLQNIGFGNLCVDRINGITFYLSKNKQISVITKVLDYCNEIFEIIGYDEKILNIGGNYRLPEEIEEGYYNALSLRLSMLRKNHNIKVLAEPGRSIVKSAGSLLTTVIDVKKEKIKCLLMPVFQLEYHIVLIALSTCQIILVVKNRNIISLI